MDEPTLDRSDRLWLVPEEEEPAPDWSLSSPDKVLLHIAANTIEDLLSGWWSLPRARRRARKLVRQLRNRIAYSEAYV